MERVLYRIHHSTAIAAIKTTSPFKRRLIWYALFLVSIFQTIGFVTFHMRYTATNIFHSNDELSCIQHKIKEMLSSDQQCVSSDYSNNRINNFKGILNINLFLNKYDGLNKYDNIIKYRYSPSKGLLDLDHNNRITYKIPQKTLNITCYADMWILPTTKKYNLHHIFPTTKQFYLYHYVWLYTSTLYFLKSASSSILYSYISFDKIVLNSFINQFNGTGYAEVPNLHVHDLNYASEFQESVRGPTKNLIFKLGVVITTVFLFFVISSLVNFTIRETQERMLKFTRVVRSNIRNRRSYFQVVLSHILHSLVFVAMIVGILFFLFEVYGEDHLLSLILLCVVWFNEIFSVLFVRTVASTRYFPTIFFIHFSLFHIYFFSYPFGFHLSALWSYISWNLYWCFYFWNFHEIPYIIENDDEVRFFLNNNENYENYENDDS
jgi:hypothetical protein